MDPVSTSVFSGIVIAAKVWDKLVARKKDASLGRMERKIDRVLDEMCDRITKLEHLTTGVNGDNGLQKNVRKLDDDMDSLKRRGFFDSQYNPHSDARPRPA